MRTLVLGLLLVGSAALGCGADDPARHPKLGADDPMADALERAASYFARKVLKGDQAWMARQGAWILGGEFDAWGDALFVETRVISGSQSGTNRLSRDRYSPLPPLPAPDVQPVPDPIYHLSRAEFRSIGRTMALSTTCPRLEGRNLEVLRGLVRKPGRSYVVTHQLWALITGYHLGCFDQATLDELRPVLATVVLRELLADTKMNDLTAERMAMLAYAGVVDWIPERLFELALATQDPSGAWMRHQVDIGPHASSSVMHASTLAFYALAARWAATRRDE